MVNPGHRSRGCQRCRLSKVKCDELRPSCGRCTRTGRVCPGFGDVEQAFISMNTTSEVSVQNRVSVRLHGKAASISISGPRSSLSQPRNSRPPSSSAVTRLSPSLSPDWTSQCVSIFCADWAETPDALHSTWGHFEFIPDMYASSSSVHLHEAVKAASLAHMANSSSIQHFNQMAKRCYGKALMDLRAAMNNRSRATEDETLAAMNVIAAYEFIAGEQPLSEVFHAHHRGQSAILRMRGEDEEHHESRWGKNLFATTNRGLIWRDMSKRSRPHLGLTEWAASTYPSPLADASARLSVRATDVRGQVYEALKVSLLHRDEKWHKDLRTIAISSMGTENDIQKCIELVPEHWRSRSLPIHFPPMPPVVSLTPNSNDADPSEDQLPLFSYPSRIDVYPSHPVASLWNFVRLARLHLLLGMLDLARLNAEDPIFEPGQDCMPSLEHLHKVLCSDIEDICASVPFVLGDVDEAGTLCVDKDHKPRPSNAAGLIWVLVKLCHIPGLHSGLRAWICELLHRLGSTGGIKVGLRLSKAYAQPPII